MTRKETLLGCIPHREEMIPKGDERITPYLADTLMKGDPDLVYRARDPQDLREILRYCHENRISVTFCGGQTSLTGGSVALEGLLVSMAKCDRLIDIRVDTATGRPQATAEPGILLGEFQRQVAEAGYFYPPDPTSRNEAQLGGTVATNATGEDSLLYGPTRQYIRRLKLLLADGRELDLVRERPYRGPTKNRAGYLLEGDPIEAFIGSEGTLGVITEVTVDLLPRPRDHFTGWAFFPNLDSALDFALAARQSRSLHPRSLELVDSPSLEIIASQDRAPAIPPRACSVSFKEEYENDTERDQVLGRWLSLLEGISQKRKASSLIHAVQVAWDSSHQEVLRTLRHAVPSCLNEVAARSIPDGGGKIATDWWVPLEKLHRMMSEVLREGEKAGIPYYVFGHIGDGHPHINYIARNRDERERAERLLVRQCRRAVALGGGVAGEHGLGKLNRHLLSLQHPTKTIEAMRRLKKDYDPHGILGRGNLFDSP